MEEVQVQIPEYAAQVPPITKSSNHSQIIDFSTDSTDDYEVPSCTSHLSCENDSIQESRSEQTIKDEQLKVRDVMNTHWHLLSKSEQLH